MIDKPSQTNAEIVDAEIIEESPRNEWQEKLMSRILCAELWLRFFFMFVFFFIAVIAGYVSVVVIVSQALFNLVTGASDKRLTAFGSSLSQYIFHTLKFLTYNSPDKPYPFKDWPQADITSESVAGDV